MSSKPWLKTLLILTLLFLMVSALPVAAQEPTGDSTEAAADEATVEPTVEPTAEPTEEATQEQPTEEATDEPTEEATPEPTEEATEEPTEEVTEEPTTEPTEEATPEPTEEPTVEPTVEPTMPITDTATITPTVELAPAEDVTASGALPGSFTSQIIAIANLNSSGVAETVGLALDQIGGTGVGNVTSGVVYPGGVSFIRSSDLPSNGQFSGILSSGFPAAAVVLTVNGTAYTADMYPGLSGDMIATTLYGTLIFNKHASIESILYCQNAGSSPTHITAELYETNDPNVKATLSTAAGGGAMLQPGEGVAWDIADNAAVQAAWPGGNGKFGYALFESTTSNPIACIIDNQRVATPYYSAQFQAVPTATSGQDLRVPLVYNGHGSSYNPAKVAKWNTGLSLVNISSNPANVQVNYTSTNGSTHTCTRQIGGNGSAVWFAPEIGTGTASGVGWTCPGPIPWSSGYTFGSARITSNVNILVIANSNKRDTSAPRPAGVGWGVGYSSLAAKPTGPTTKAVCPLAFNPATGVSANDAWASGIQATNVGGGSTNISFKMVRAGVNPTGAGNSVTLSGGAFNNVAAGGSATAYFPEQAAALKGFEGAVFVESSGQPIVVAQSATNYNTLSSAALYDCINY